jgi:tetratricopeptide (TPR) repeat protein
VALHHNGDQTNAFISLTNFMGRFPTNDLAPLAQWWIADFYFDRGAYAAAETNYQAIAANYPKSELAFQASLKAGRAAVGRTSWDNAAKYYFRPLATNPACPPEVRQEAWFELGDATINQTSTNRIENYAEAIQIYSRAAEPTNGLGILAWGQIASCYLQWASSASQLTNAIDYFQRVINEPKADAVARSIAKAGIAIVLQKQAADGPPAQLLAARKAALNHYLDVFDRRMLRPGESPDAFWTRKAGLEAAQLATLLEQWEVAARIYARLIELMPELRGPFQERLNKALEKVQLQEKVARAN